MWETNVFPFSQGFWWRSILTNVSRLQVSLELRAYFSAAASVGELDDDRTQYLSGGLLESDLFYCHRSSFLMSRWTPQFYPHMDTMFLVCVNLPKILMEEQLVLASTTKRMTTLVKHMSFKRRICPVKMGFFLTNMLQVTVKIPSRLKGSF